MCGITGFITAGNYYTSVKMERFFTSMTNAIVHCGPDHGGSWSDSFEITDYDNEQLVAKYHRMDMVVGDKTYFAFTEETDISALLAALSDRPAV